MSLSLPPERMLPDPDAMIDRILAEPSARPARAGYRTAFVAVAAAAVVALLAAVVGLGVLGQDGPQFAGPAPAPVPVTTFTPSVAYSAGAESPAVQLGGVAKFGGLTVQLLGFEREDHWFGLRVKTCVTAVPPGPNDRVRLDWKAWTLTTSKGAVDTSIRQEGTGPCPDTYPYQHDYRAGECQTGWIPIGWTGRSTSAWSTTSTPQATARPGSPQAVPPPRSRVWSTCRTSAYG